MIKHDDTKQKVKLLHEKVKQLLLAHKTEEQIIIELSKDGIDSQYAQVIIENVNDDKADKKSFRSSLIMGGFYLASGLLLNYFSYSIAAASNSFFFYLFWGILILGIVTIVRGFILYK